ncbi:hypothetical protein F4810DRAFT_694069 [Camillea tinctor]|nr:hypothetical protein F4810DRAFT_694069 [Camillea tinctor]
MWTLPNVEWMNSAEVEMFSRIVSTMTRALRNTIHTQKHTPTPYRNTWAESKTRLYLSRSSTPSEISYISQQNITPNTATSPNHDTGDEFAVTQCESEPKCEGSLHTKDVIKPISTPACASTGSTISAKLGYEDLPFSCEIHSGVSFIDIEVNSVHLYFDFTSISRGQFRISQSTESEGPNPTVDMASLPSGEELRIGCAEDRPSTRFRLSHATHPQIIVELIWGEI